MNDTGRLSILHCSAPATFGGLETVLWTLAEGMRARSHDVRIVATVEGDPSRHPFLRSLSDSGIPVEPLVLSARAYLRESRSLRRLMRDFRPTVVHTHGFRSDVIAGMVARRLRLPIVTTAHGFTFGDLKNRAYEAIQRRAFRSFDAVVAVSRPLEQELLARGVPRERLHLIPNAIGPVRGQLDRARAREALGVPAEGFRLGWIGRLSAEKGADVLIEAIGGAGGEDIAVSVIGSGPELESLRRRAAELGIDHRITWHGQVEGAARYLPAFDALVMSSRTEGTPMVLLEAMSSRLPIVTTRVGGIPGVVSDAEAILVRPESPEELARGIRRVRDDSAGARERAERAAVRLQAEHGVEAWLDRYQSIYRGISGNRNQR